MRAVFFWEPAGLSIDRANPYAALLARAMAEVGVELVAGHPGDITEAWLLENRQEVDVLHLNWLHRMYEGEDLSDRVSRCADLVGCLAQARTMGYKIVWTVHNLYPHEMGHMGLDRLGRLAITHLATALIVHCEHARSCVQEHFFRSEDVFTIPHGHFIQAYPNTISREEARRQLNLPQENFVYLFFGNIRPYKGVEHLLEVFSSLPGDDLTLLMAGKTNTDYSVRLIQQAQEGDPRIAVHTEQFFPNEDFQRFLNAADAVVLPFLDILTSGSAITAMSFARPVIVPGIGCLPELVDEDMGVLYDPDRPDALKQAMVAIRQRDLVACGRAAYRRAESLSWASIAELTLEAYQH